MKANTLNSSSSCGNLSVFQFGEHRLHFLGSLLHRDFPTCHYLFLILTYAEVRGHKILTVWYL